MVKYVIIGCLKNGGYHMKKKLVATLGLTGVLALTFGLTNDLQNSTVSAQEQPDKSTVITTEEQNMVESLSANKGFVPQANGTGFVFVKEKLTDSKDSVTVITAQEQNMVEEMAEQAGFVAQEDGNGFFYIKE